LFLEETMIICRLFYKAGLFLPYLTLFGKARTNHWKGVLIGDLTMTLSLHCTPLVLGITRGIALQYFLCPAIRLLVAFHPRSHTASMWAPVTQLHVQNPSSSGPCGIGYSCMWPLPRSYGQADLINRISSPHSCDPPLSPRFPPRRWRLSCHD
jgi:hypothetical protein